MGIDRPVHAARMTMPAPARTSRSFRCAAAAVILCVTPLAAAAQEAAAGAVRVTLVEKHAPATSATIMNLRDQPLVAWDLGVARHRRRCSRVPEGSNRGPRGAGFRAFIDSGEPEKLRDRDHTAPAWMAARRARSLEDRGGSIPGRPRAAADHQQRGSRRYGRIGSTDRRHRLTAAVLRRRRTEHRNEADRSAAIRLLTRWGTAPAPIQQDYVWSRTDARARASTAGRSA